MKELEKNSETFIEDEVTLRLRFPKEWGSMTKGNIQEILNKCIEDEYVPSLDKCGEQYVPN